MVIPAPRVVPAVNYEACRRLWAAVIIEHVRILDRQAFRCTDLDIYQASNWFFSSGFSVVCELANVDADKLVGTLIRDGLLDPTQGGRS